MKSLSVVLLSCVAMALAAPQLPYNSQQLVLPGVSGQQYTLSNRAQGFSIESGAASAAPRAAIAPVAVAPVAVRTAAVQPAAAYYSHAASAAAAAHQQAAARKAVVVAQPAPAPIHYAPLSFAAHDQVSAHYVADQSAAFAAKQSAAHRSAVPVQQYSAAGFRSAQIAPSANIVRQQQDISDDGSAFTYGFESDNGIAVQSQGNLKVLGPEQAGHSVSGSYSYVGDDGQTYTVNYVADETGFHASGAHLPQMSEEIARSVEYNLAHPEEWTQ